MPVSTSDSFDDLKAVVLSALERPAELLATECQFDELALRVYRFQRASNPFYSRFCDAVGAPQNPARWHDIPAVPASAFKRAEIRSFPPEQTVAFFQTSGTTDAASGRHFFSTLDLYEAAILPNFRAHLLPDLPAGERTSMHILTPPPDEATHSSLVHMMRTVVGAFGAPDSAYYLRDGRLQSDELLRNLDRAASAGRPVFLLGTAFAFVYFLEALAAAGRADLPLPAGSRLMETGGFKGRTRDVPRAEFYKSLSDTFSLPPERIVNEYGMTELSSQFYDASLVEGGSTAGKSIPPWTRVLSVDPASGHPVPDGENGLLRIFDLANLGSVLALQVEDAGICRGRRFEVLGRVAAAPPRGCSLAADDALRPPNR